MSPVSTSPVSTSPVSTSPVSTSPVSTSPVSMATGVQTRVQAVSPLPYPTTDLLLRLAREIVVDWQLPSDLEREGH